VAASTLSPQQCLRCIETGDIYEDGCIISVNLKKPEIEQYSMNPGSKCEGKDNEEQINAARKSSLEIQVPWEKDRWALQGQNHGLLSN
jgi:hypothetical protein